eukprot:6188037-Amphidinium_carterae.1
MLPEHIVFHINLTAAQTSLLKSIRAAQPKKPPAATAVPGFAEVARSSLRAALLHHVPSQSLAEQSRPRLLSPSANVNAQVGGCD